MADREILVFFTLKKIMETMYENAVGATELMQFAQMAMAKPRRKKKEDGESKGSPIAFRPTPGQRENLEKAVQATGADMTKLLSACVDQCLTEVVQKIVVLRRTAEAAFFQKQGKGNEPRKEE